MNITNLLTAMIGNLSPAKMYAKPGYEVYDVLAEAEKTSIRAKDLNCKYISSGITHSFIFLKNVGKVKVNNLVGLSVEATHGV
jgi:hypothetical protein